MMLYLETSSKIENLAKNILALNTQYKQSVAKTWPLYNGSEKQEMKQLAKELLAAIA